MDGAEVGILEQSYQVCFCGLLQGDHSLLIEPDLSTEIVGYLTDQALEWQLAKQLVDDDNMGNR